MNSSRLDKALVTRGLVPSRARALNLIGSGKVSVNGSIIDKPDREVHEADTIELLGEDLKWVSRAGSKLEHALDHWKIDVTGKTVLDIGASTGGFTEVLLSRGAKKVYALDVGHGQLREKLRNDPRVINMEGVHIKDVTKNDLSEEPELIVIDVSFISLTKVLPKVRELLGAEGKLIALIKPQFEVGKEYINKGIVKDPLLHEKVVALVSECARSLSLSLEPVILSPIEGGDGNKEFLLYAQLSNSGVTGYTQSK